MKNEPKIIYLNCFDEAETNETYFPIDNDFDSLDGENILWSADEPALGGNIKFIHHSEVDRLINEAVKVALKVASERATTYNANEDKPYLMPADYVCPKSILSCEEEVLKQLNIQQHA